MNYFTSFCSVVRMSEENEMAAVEAALMEEDNTEATITETKPEEDESDNISAVKTEDDDVVKGLFTIW